MINRRLHLCGPGEIQFTPPPGTLTLPLEMAASGHLLLPFTEYEKGERQKKNEVQLQFTPVGATTTTSEMRSSSASSQGKKEASPQ